MSAYWETLVAGVSNCRDRHRPDDPQTLRAAALELRQRGLTDRDIASALRLTEPTVRQLLDREAA
jgi:DNA-binding NarL/FixJ family response regulator